MIELTERANNKCELCGSTEELRSFVLEPKPESIESSVLICHKCSELISSDVNNDPNHWRCLSESMWSEYLPVQVMTWRVLNSLNDSWAKDLQSQMYLDEETMDWALAGINSGDTKDSNGTPLSKGDSVTLIKDLVVKGANFTAKRGTLVKNISLTDDPKYIEGKVNGTQIVLVAAFLKKA